MIAIFLERGPAMPDIADNFRAKTYDVFVSYKREDDAARATLVEELEAAGYVVFWDAKLNNDDWKDELRDEINRCKLVICLWSAKAAGSDAVKAEAYHAFGLKRLLSAPIEDKRVVPDYFKNTNIHPFDGWADETRRERQIEKILGTVERVTGKPRRKREPIRPMLGSSLVASPEFGDIPGAPDKLIGRDDELTMLRDAWASRIPKKVNAVVFHALGGAGKSALLRTFANELLAAGGGGASRIYGWSAYSQGSGEQKRADADSFISKALGDFGWQGELPKDPVERGRALAKLIQKERVLLLLDGLEPLQDAPNVNKGRFKDKGLAELVKLLAGHNPGLVVLTTRQEVPELEGFGPVVINHELDQLSDHAGADLLVELGVHGRQRELEAAVHELQGHALSVTLLGTYLAEVCGGDIRHKDQFDFAHIVLSPEEQSELLTDKTIIPAKRAAKVMRGYLAQFEKLAQDGGAERAILNLLGLFDRPADGPAVDALLAKHIPGLTDELFFEKIEKARRAFQVTQDQARAASRSQARRAAARGEEPLAEAAALIQGQSQGPARAGCASGGARLLRRPPRRDRAGSRQGRARDPLPPLCSRGAGPARHAGGDAAAVPRRPARREGRAGCRRRSMRCSRRRILRAENGYLVRVLGALGPTFDDVCYLLRNALADTAPRTRADGPGVAAQFRSVRADGAGAVE